MTTRNEAGEFTRETKLAEAIVALAESLQTNQEGVQATLEALRANQPPRDVSFGDVDYQVKLRAETKVFPRPVFQGGREANASGLSDETLAKIADLKPGTYLGGFVRIIGVQQDGIDFYYKNATPDQRMAQMARFSSFTDLVDKCWAELPSPPPAA